MAWVDEDGQFHMNRKGRRWLEKQIGRDAHRLLQTERAKKAGEMVAEREQAWKDEKKLDK